MTNFVHMDQLITLSEAAKRFGTSEEYIREFVQKGAMRAAILPGGEIGISSDMATIVILNARLQEIDRSQFSHLNEIWITIANASKKYDVPNGTLRNWLENGYIQVEKSLYPAKMNEGDVAYCASIYIERRAHKLVTGAPLLNESKRPYVLKHPGLSGYRRRRKANQLL